MLHFRIAQSVLLACVVLWRTGFAAAGPILKEITTMPIEGLKGGFDHFAIDLARHRLYLAAEDQKTVEVFDLTAQKHILTISLFSRPHGLIFLRDSSILVVADGGDGSCKFVDVSSDTPKVLATVKTALRADSVAFDANSRTIFVTNGGMVAKMDYSLVTAISASKEDSIGEVKINSKILEAMAVEKESARLFVNLMEKNSVTVIDRKKMQILSNWFLSAGMPASLALDESNHRLFVACRKPGRLLVLDTNSGKEITNLPCTGHADDAFYDATKKRIYVSGGEDGVSVYQQNSPDSYTLLGNVATGPEGKTSLFVPELNELFVAVPPSSSQPAKVMTFSTVEQ
jgi:DNA-binding beta-propeller fold protein YncE